MIIRETCRFLISQFEKSKKKKISFLFFNFYLLYCSFKSRSNLQTKENRKYNGAESNTTISCEA